MKWMTVILEFSSKLKENDIGDRAIHLRISLKLGRIKPDL